MNPISSHRREQLGHSWVAWLFVFAFFVSTNTKAQGFEEAFKVYREQFAKSPQGIYVAKGMVFVVAEQDKFPREGTTSAIRAKSAVRLSKVKRLLHSHVIESYYPEKATVKQSAILRKYPIVHELVAKQYPGLLLPKFEFRLSGHQLESKVTGRQYRYAVAYYERDLKDQIPEKLAGAKTEDLILALKKLRQKYTTDKAWALLDRLHLQTGAMEESLNLAGQNLAADYSLAGFSVRPVEDLAIFYTNLAEAHRFLEGKPSTKEIAQALEKAPALPQALDQLAVLCQKEGRHLQAANIHLMRLVSPSNHKDGWAKVLANVRTQAKASNAKAHQQYLKLLTDFSTTPMSGVYESKEDTRGILRGVWRTYGHLNFPDAWSAEEPEGYRLAMKLFAARGDVDQMITHLKVAMQKSPRHAPSWNLLGRCLMIQGKHLQALPALNQANRLSDDALPRTNLALSYESLKYPELAQGMALGALLAPNNTEWTRKESHRIISQ